MAAGNLKDTFPISNFPPALANPAYKTKFTDLTDERREQWKRTVDSLILAGATDQLGNRWPSMNTFTDGTPADLMYAPGARVWTPSYPWTADAAYTTDTTGTSACKGAFLLCNPPGLQVCCVHISFKLIPCAYL